VGLGASAAMGREEQSKHLQLPRTTVAYDDETANNPGASGLPK